MFSKTINKLLVARYALALACTIAHIHGVVEGYAIAIDRSPNQHSQNTLEDSFKKPPDAEAASAAAPKIARGGFKKPPEEAGPQVYDPRRPIWNLAHMVNSIKELDYRLEKGANAVEVDITFSRDGAPLFTYHGPPCDCWRHCHQQEDFNDYLKYVREIAIEEPEGIGKNLSLLFLDLKLDYLDTRAKARAGMELAESIIENLFSPSSQPPEVELNTQDLAAQQQQQQPLPTTTTEKPATPAKKLYLILSVNHVTDVELIYNFLHYLDVKNSSHLLNWIGFDVGMNDEIQLIESMWKKFKNNLNVWQGDGYTNCFSPFYNLERLSKALVKRDNELGFPSKVYHWTIDLHDRMRESLLLGVDAVMTNHPERLLSILQEPEMADNFRLANKLDNPFKKITRRASAGSSPRSTLNPRRERSSPNVPAAGGFLGSLLDVFNSWFAYVKEIPFLSLPTTSRFMPKTKRQRPISARNDGANNNNETNSQNSPPQPLPKQEAEPFEGPKWYTTMASNFLLTLLKVFLPTG